MKKYIYSIVISFLVIMIFPQISFGTAVPGPVPGMDCASRSSIGEQVTCLQNSIRQQTEALQNQISALQRKIEKL